MKSLKNKLLVGALSSALMAPTMLASTASYGAGVPVFDASSFARQLQQLQEAYKQLEQAKAQYDQFRGDRDIGKLFNQYGKYLPKDMQDMYRDYQRGDWAGMADKIAQLEKQQKLSGSQKQILEQMANSQRMSAMKNKVKLDDMFAKSTQRFEQIQRMANSVDLQHHPTATADLLNRIQVENAMLQLQTNQLQMVGMMRKAEKELEQQQRLDHSRKFNSTGGKQVHQWK